MRTGISDLLSSSRPGGSWWKRRTWKAEILYWFGQSLFSLLRTRHKPRCSKEQCPSPYEQDIERCKCMRRNTTAILYKKRTTMWFPLFHFSLALKECDAETLGHLLLSEIGNNAIIARCFHPQILDLVFRCNVHLRRGEQAYVKER